MVETYHRRHRRKNVAITELPHDVFYNILLRLPVRSLIYCLCVSKQWHSIIKSPMFANMHLKRITHGDHQNHHKLLVLHRNIPCTFSTFDCETLDLGPCRPVPFEVTNGNIRIKSSCNGLVLVTLKKDVSDTMFSDLILWNPLTGDYKTLSKPKYYKELYDKLGNVFEMYYNSSEEDYRLLRITYRHNVYIYSLKSDTWRRIKLKDAFESVSNFIHKQHKMLFKGSIWLAGTWNENLYLNTYGNKIVFDTKTEKFTEINTLLIYNQQTHSEITVQRGCMYLWVKYRIQRDRISQEYIKLFKMKEDGDWGNISTYIHDAKDLDRFLRPLHLMRGGNWLMKTQTNLNGYWEEGKYIETFVSPNGGSKVSLGSRKNTRLVKRPTRCDD
ncbi:F-box/kelch-repeat protein-like protein [Tanacetum coccineum]